MGESVWVPKLLGVSTSGSSAWISISVLTGGEGETGLGRLMCCPSDTLSFTVMCLQVTSESWHKVARGRAGVGCPEQRLWRQRAVCLCHVSKPLEVPVSLSV